MKYRRLGSSQFDVSVLSFGCWQLAAGDYWGPHEHPERAVRAALDRGINLYDVAEGYAAGESEEVLGRALGADRDKVLIATKVSAGHTDSEGVKKACEDSLRRLGTDRIDLYQVHWPPRHVPFDEAAAALLRLRDEGKVREIGLSNFGAQDLREWFKTGSAVSNQLGYNILFRAIEYEIVPECSSLNLGILVYMPLLQGILSGRWKDLSDIPPPRRRTRHFSCERPGTRHDEAGHEVLLSLTLQQFMDCAGQCHCEPATLALAWVLAQPGIVSVIVGNRKPEQIERNLAAVELGLDQATLEHLDGITEPLKKALGTNPDMWQAQQNSRIR